MYKLVSIFLGSILLSGCASTPEIEGGCPQNLAEMDRLKFESQVIKCFGEPSTKMNGEDETYTALYNLVKGTSTIFLYEKDGKVIRNRSYQR